MILVVEIKQVYAGILLSESDKPDSTCAPADIVPLNFCGSTGMDMKHGQTKAA